MPPFALGRRRRKLPTITVRWLKRRKACASQLDLFVDTFGKDAAVEPSREALRKASAAGLNLCWLGERLLYAPQSTYLIARIVTIVASAHQRVRAESYRAEAHLNRLRTGIQRSLGPHAPVTSDYSVAPINLPTPAELQRVRDVAMPALEEAMVEVRRIYARRMGRAARRIADLVADALGLP